MIDSISIQNFQSHKDTRLVFSPGVNVIVGPSDSGKTAIIRALRWLVFNRPVGDAFRSDWGGDTQVAICVDNHEISRQKSKKTNGYMLRLLPPQNAEIQSSPMDAVIINGLPFDAIKTDVPDEIAQALNMTEINLQQQLDRPFLLDNSPGEVAAHFNNVANLDAIDRGLQNVQRGMRQIEQDIKSAETRQTELETELTDYEHLDMFDSDVAVLEDLSRQQDGLERRINELGLFVRDSRSIEDNLAKYDNLDALATLVDETSGLIGQKAGLSNQIRDLSGLLRQLTDADRQLATERKILEEMEKRFKIEFPDVCPLCGQEVQK